MAQSKLVVAMDGPAGAGKSTVAKLVAEQLGCTYVDTGSMYRALTLKAMRLSMVDAAPEALGMLARATAIHLDPIVAGAQLVFLDGEDVSLAIRAPDVSKAVSTVSAVAEVRHEVVAQQRLMVAACGAVMDGRDIGTVVLPDADLKFYIDAAPEIRAFRRREELARAGVERSFESVLQEILERDRKDSTREVSPLRKADGAIVIDTGHRTVPEVVGYILEQCSRHQGASAEIGPEPARQGGDPL